MAKLSDIIKLQLEDANGDSKNSPKKSSKADKISAGIGIGSVVGAAGTAAHFADKTRRERIAKQLADMEAAKAAEEARAAREARAAEEAARAAEVARAAREASKGKFEKFKEKASEYGHAAKEKVSEYGHAAKEKAAHLAELAKEHPKAAAALAAGTALGAGLGVYKYLKAKKNRK